MSIGYFEVPVIGMDRVIAFYSQLFGASFVCRCNDPVKFCSVTMMKRSQVSKEMNDDVKRWTAKRKAALVKAIIQDKTTVSEASRSFDLSPSEIENWVDEAKRGIENALSLKPFEVKELYVKQIKDLQ